MAQQDAIYRLEALITAAVRGLDNPKGRLATLQDASISRTNPKTDKRDASLDADTKRRSTALLVAVGGPKRFRALAHKVAGFHANRIAFLEEGVVFSKAAVIDVLREAASPPLWASYSGEDRHLLRTLEENNFLLQVAPSQVDTFELCVGMLCLRDRLGQTTVKDVWRMVEYAGSTTFKVVIMACAIIGAVVGIMQIVKVMTSRMQ